MPEEDSRQAREQLRGDPPGQALVTSEHVRTAITHYRVFMEVRGTDIWDDYIGITGVEQDKIIDVISEVYDDEEPLVSEGVLIGILAARLAAEEQ